MCLVDVIQFAVGQPWRAFPLFMASYSPILLGLVLMMRIRTGAGSVGPWLVRTIKLVASGIPVAYFVVTILGAHSMQLWKGNLLLAVLLSLLVGIPLGKDIDAPIHELAFSRGIPFETAQLKYLAYFTVLGAWLGAFPIPLDWDRPWQVWPVSCCLGAIGGHFAGCLVYTLHQNTFPRQNQLHQKECSGRRPYSGIQFLISAATVLAFVFKI